MEQRTIKATINLSCDVIINDLIKSLAESECSSSLSDEETARKILFAFLNPKIESFNEEDDMLTGQWDTVCDFKGRLNNFIISHE
ncbi:hypothetical protein [Robertmurraya kyonggiensis]|uniref:Uncharacterized protein n=1 Tax=Robertmurraya kyonggiensis TaxID=1037680 RepID=A0A4U1DF28_9BACI|nr:hypothetical protein [Robertmurraya kyonggiensis]TKC19896.1 hypothetical protein FA727_10285 [Robertmurraya kyonggiensis]